MSRFTCPRCLIVVTSDDLSPVCPLCYEPVEGARRSSGAARTILTVLLFVGVSAFVAVLAWGGKLAYEAAESKPGDKVEERSRTRCEEEEIVKRYILDNANDPSAVEFARWGPHYLTNELKLKPPESELQIVRVCYRSTNVMGAKQFHDWIFVLRDGKVWVRGPNDGGDGWKDQFKAMSSLVRSFQGASKETKKSR